MEKLGYSHSSVPRVFKRLRKEGLFGNVHEHIFPGTGRHPQPAFKHWKEVEELMQHIKFKKKAFDFLNTLEGKELKETLKKNQSNTIQLEDTGQEVGIFDEDLNKFLICATKVESGEVICIVIFIDAYEFWTSG